MTTPVWVIPSFLAGIGIGLTLLYGVSIDEADYAFMVFEKLLGAYNPELLGLAAILGAIITAIGIFQVFYFYYGLLRVGLITTISGGMLFLAGILILVPGAQGYGVVFLISGILGSIVTKHYEVPLLE